MLFLKILIGLIVLFCALFFLLGLMSQKGKATGIVDGYLSPLSAKPNSVSSEPDTQPEKRVMPLATSLSNAKQALLDTGATITTETDTYISATYMSSVFKFVDDVELRDAGNGVVHVRSSSRVGYSDRGVNRKRVEEIRKALK